MESPNLIEPTPAFPQNLYTCRSSALYSFSVTLKYAGLVSAKLISAPQSVCVDAKVVCVTQLVGYNLKA
jgi:hypothetical protein